MSDATGLFLRARAGAVSYTYDPAAVAFFARLQTQPTQARAILYSNFFAALRSAGILTIADGVWLEAAANAQAANLNLISSNYTLNPVNSPTFTVDRGYNGDGVSSYVDTTFNPTTAVAPNYVQDSAYFGIWSLTPGQSTNPVAGAVVSGGTLLLPYGSPSLFTGRANNAGTGATATVGTGLGYFSVTRSAPTVTTISNNGIALATGSTASAAVQNISFRLGTNGNGTFATTQIAVTIVGSSLTSGQDLAFYNAALAYLHGVGSA